MGLFSKLFGDETGEKADKALNALKDLVETAAKEVKNAAQTQQDTQQKPASPASSGPSGKSFSSSAAFSGGPSGESWGEVMPAEENQFSFSGTYLEYFEGIFRSEFPEYRLDIRSRGDRTTVFTFYDGARQALVVELLPSSSEAKAIRERCRKTGTPYLRYYYDHEGWWNTRSYVVKRTRAALNS